MSGQHDGRVFRVRNVRIPKGVYGWEVDLTEPDYLVKVYVPNRCGNLSLVRVRRAQVLAVAPAYHDTALVPSAPVSAFIGAPVFVPSSATPVAYAPLVPMPAAAAQSHLGLLPLLLGGIVAGFFASGGHGSGITVASHPNTPPSVVPPPVAVVAAPTPQPSSSPVSCPTAARRRRP